MADDRHLASGDPPRWNNRLVAIRPPKDGVPKHDAPHLRGLSQSELAAFFHTAVGGPAYRSGQVFDWVHNKRVDDIGAMSNLSKADRDRLASSARLSSLDVDAVLHAADGTKKLRLRTEDGHAIESVLIPNDERGMTLCVSSQVGCALTCRFCATASLGFLRNLDTWEIVDQVYRAIDVLDALPGSGPDGTWRPRLTNLVYMGMGEPLHNFNHVKRSLEILTDGHGVGISGKRITVSTSGLVPAIERFGREGLGKEVGLAISLNATTDPVRDTVMPINTRWKIAELLAAVRAVPLTRRRSVTFEYVLLADTNDSDDDARRLIALVGDMRCHVNLIPFNPHEHAPYRRPAPARVQQFASLLRSRGMRVYVRTPRGDDIGAACGQLALSDPKS